MTSAGRDGSAPGWKARLLGALIDAVHVTPPHQLAELLARQSAHAGLRDLVLQLQDYDQQQLLPVPVAGRPDQDVEVLDSSMAGRAFTTHDVLEAGRLDGVRMWAPLLDGTDRVGVLSVTVDAADEPTRTLVRRLAGLVADLIVTKGAYTDVFFRRRRRRPMFLRAQPRRPAPGDPRRDGPRTARRGDGQPRYRRVPARTARRGEPGGSTG